jgi:hypothetical protein
MRMALMNAKAVKSSISYKHLCQSFAYMILMIACQGTNSIDPADNNDVEIKVNGQIWNNSPGFSTRSFAFYACGASVADTRFQKWNNYISLVFFKDIEVNKQKVIVEAMHADGIPLRVGIHYLTGDYLKACLSDTIPSINYTTHAADVTIDQYIANPKTNNFVQIHSINKTTGMIEGSIEASMYRVRKDIKSTYPDTIKIHNTTFKMFLEVNN